MRTKFYYKIMKSVVHSLFFSLRARNDCPPKKDTLMNCGDYYNIPPGFVLPEFSFKIKVSPFPPLVCHQQY